MFLIFLHILSSKFLYVYLLNQYADEKKDAAFWFSFEEAGFNDVVMENLRKAKYAKPTPVQKWAIPSILEGRDIMSCAQTGSGKTVRSFSLLGYFVYTRTACAYLLYRSPIVGCIVH